VVYLPQTVTHPSTKQTRRIVLIETNALPASQAATFKIAIWKYWAFVLGAGSFKYFVYMKACSLMCYEPIDIERLNIITSRSTIYRSSLDDLFPHQQFLLKSLVTVGSWGLRLVRSLGCSPRSW